MVVTRFAPSPTGYLHIGSLRTLLYNYLYAKKYNGKFMLRIEDTDRTRLVEGSVENMISLLNKFGLNPDEGPNSPGDYGPYYQSERLELYNKHIKTLLKKDKAYRCFCSKERLDKLRAEQESLSLPTKYDGCCRFLSKEEIQNNLDKGVQFTIRLKVPKGQKVVFMDEIKGKIEVDTKDIDDQVLIKSDGFPTYHFANVVDDHLMKVTDVIRGDEWTPSTPKHILMYHAFGWTPPTFSHIPLLLGTDKKKLSKRIGDVAVEKYIEKGYLLESILNYIAMLGWNSKTTEEFFSIDELIKLFDIKNVHKAGAVFDIEKLNWYNSKYVANYNVDKLYILLETYLKEFKLDFYNNIFSKYPKDYNKKILNELKSKLIKFEDFPEMTLFFYHKPKNNNELMVNPKMKINDISIAKKGLEIALDITKNNEDFTSVDEVKYIFVEKIKEAKMKNGQVLWPTRVSLSGEKYSPGALELIYILGNKESSIRLEETLKNI